MSGWGSPEYMLLRSVRRRRVIAWFIDLLIIGVLVAGLWMVLFLFGLLTLGLGFPLLGVLPFVPFCYHLLSLLSAASATPGQYMMDLIVRRDDDLGPPTGLQAVISTVVYYLTLMTSGLLLLVSLLTTRKRTLHDLASGLVVVRRDAWEALTGPAASWNMPQYT